MFPFLSRAEPLKVGDKAPDFTLPDQDGKPVALRAALSAGPALLVFYPRDFSPMCSRQLSMFRDGYPEIRAAGAEVLGKIGRAHV